MFKHGNWIFCLLEINLSLSSLHIAHQPSFMTSPEKFSYRKGNNYQWEVDVGGKQSFAWSPCQIGDRHHGRQSVRHLKIRESYLLIMFYETKNQNILHILFIFSQLFQKIMKCCAPHARLLYIMSLILWTL